MRNTSRIGILGGYFGGGTCNDLFYENLFFMRFDYFDLLHSCYILIWGVRMVGLVLDMIGSDFDEFMIFRDLQSHRVDFK